MMSEMATAPMSEYNVTGWLAGVAQGDKIVQVRRYERPVLFELHRIVYSRYHKVWRPEGVQILVNESSLAEVGSWAMESGFVFHEVDPGSDFAEVVMDFCTPPEWSREMAIVRAAAQPSFTSAYRNATRRDQVDYWAKFTVWEHYQLRS